MHPRLLADIPSPWNHKAKRFIEAPVYCFPTPDLIAPHADFWRLELMQDGVRHTVESDKPVLDSGPIWPKLRVGSWIQARVYQIDRANNWCVTVTALGAHVKGTSVSLIAKAPDWEDHDEPPLDYADSLRRNFAWFDGHEQNPNAYYREPGMPAWWWHAAENSAHPTLKFAGGTYPSLAAQAIRAYMFAARAVPNQAEGCRKVSRAIGDWLLKNRTPATGATPCMPWTEMAEGKFEYAGHGGAINLSRGAFPGYGMLLLFQDSGERKYLEYAQHIPGVFAKFIREDGSMPYRIHHETGEVVEEYTCGHVLVALFLDALHQVAPDPRWRDPVRLIIRWICEHPMRNFNWKACYEDVDEKTDFVNLSGMDALWAARLLCRHAKEDPQHIERARKLFRWVEDQFVNFGDESSLGLRTYYPSVREQWICDHPMEGHASNYAESCWELYKATGEEVFRHKITATLNAIVRSQRSDGAYSTWGVDREYKEERGGNWFNANHNAMSALSCFLLRQKGETPLAH